jgi:hypothetical protein
MRQWVLEPFENIYAVVFVENGRRVRVRYAHSYNEGKNFILGCAVYLNNLRRQEDSNVQKAYKTDS